MHESALQAMTELRRCAILLRRSFRGGHEHLSLNVGGQSRLLSILRENPGISQKTVAELLHVRPQTMGEQLTRLEGAGLIERRVNEYDRRVQNLFLTEAGIEAARAVEAHSEETLRQIFADFSEEELQQLLHLTQKVNAAIERCVDPEELAPHHHPPHGPHTTF